MRLAAGQARDVARLVAFEQRAPEALVESLIERRADVSQVPYKASSVCESGLGIDVGIEVQVRVNAQALPLLRSEEEVDVHVGVGQRSRLGVRGRVEPG